MYDRNFCCLLLISILFVADPEYGRAVPPKSRNMQIAVREASLRDVLLVLARYARCNVLISKNVSGKVSLELNDIPPLEAIGLVARINGYQASIVGRVVCIGTCEDIAGLRQGGKYALLQLRNARSRDMQKLLSRVFEGIDVVEDSRTNSVVIIGKP